MAEEKNNVPATEEKVVSKKVKSADKKPNFFVRVGQKIAKIWKDTVGELKKVVWTPRKEVFKSFQLVIATIVAVAIVIAIIDFSSSWIINSIAGLIG